MVSVAILGASGRMGQSLIKSAGSLDYVSVAAAIECAGHTALGKDAGEVAGRGGMGLLIVEAKDAPVADVVIDFTFHAAVPANIALARARGQAYVLGTTGLTADEQSEVEAAASEIPIVWAPNMSLGVNLLLDLVERAARILDTRYDVEIVEMHHRHKQDAPSGTALGLAEAVAKGREVALDSVACYGRQGITGARPQGDIAIHALRGGDVVGDHRVVFAADGERVELGHKASSRECFARGALVAARWIKGRKPGVYSMRDVLGLA
jgi:4-hydroxy-tetrahydrodipicolinate reductase